MMNSTHDERAPLSMQIAFWLFYLGSLVLAAQLLPTLLSWAIERMVTP